jgi:hypothetical protein
MIKEAILLGFKEFLRIVLLAAIPVVIAGIEQGNLDYRLVASAVAIAILKAIDRGIHEYGVMEEIDKSTAKKPYESEWITGLVRF